MPLVHRREARIAPDAAQSDAVAPVDATAPPPSLQQPYGQGAADTAPESLSAQHTANASVGAQDADGSKGAEGAKVARASFIMFLGTLTSRILGVVRSPILLGAALGITTPSANAFELANRLPSYLYVIIAGGLIDAVLVPAIVKASKQHDSGEAFINKLITLAIVVIGGITALLTLASPIIVRLFAAAISPDWFNITVIFAYWCIPQVFFYGMYAVLGQILNARENFGPYMWAPALNNVVAIIGLLLLIATYGRNDPTTLLQPGDWTPARTAMLAGIATAGIASQALVLLIPMRRIGIRYRPDFAWRNSGLGSAGRASFWVLANMAASMLVKMTESNVAAIAGDAGRLSGMDLETIAGNAAVGAGQSIYNIPTALITVSITTAMFTRLSRAAADGNTEQLKSDASLTVRIISIINFPLMGLLVFFSLPISRILSPAITPTETYTLAYVVSAMSLGLIGASLMATFNRVLFALEDTRGVFFATAPSYVLSIMAGFAITLVFPEQLMVIALEVMFSLMNGLIALCLYMYIRYKLKGVFLKGIFGFFVKLFIASFASCLAAYFLVYSALSSPQAVSESVWQSIWVLVIAGIVAIALYIVLLKILGVREMNAVGRMLGGRIAPIVGRVLSLFKR